MTESVSKKTRKSDELNQDFKMCLKYAQKAKEKQEQKTGKQCMNKIRIINKEILEFKIITTKLKNSLEGFNIRLGQSEERKQTQKLVV